MIRRAIGVGWARDVGGQEEGGYGVWPGAETVAAHRDWDDAGRREARKTIRTYAGRRPWV